MAIVAVSGYITGYGIRQGTNGQYCIIDLLQFGDRDKRSEIIPILVYDSEIQNALYSAYTNGDIRDITMLVDIVKNKTDYMWICTRVLHLGNKKQLEDFNVNVEVKEGEEFGGE